MEKALQEQVSAFRDFVKKMTNYDSAISCLGWDARTGMPKNGVADRAEVIGTLATEHFKMGTSSEMEAFLNELSEPETFTQLDEITQGIVKECKKEFDRNNKIPADRFQAYIVLTSNAEAAWEEAREKSDFQSFQPYLEKIVETNREFIEKYWGYEENKYDTLINFYEPGLTVAKLDQIFGDLREKSVQLLQKITSSGNQIDTSFLTEHYATEDQKAFSKFILEEMGYSFDSGRLDETVHPFASAFNPGDVRVTTRYNSRDVREALFGSIHEGGHALYEQNVSLDLVGTPLCSGTSMGIHESQSRYWENMIGRSRMFWEKYYDDLINQFPDQLGHIALEDFYRAINAVEPSLIRVKADELTYNLHIMIRYEIEKGLINGEIEVADLPDIWNTKYEEYLGVTPPNDSEGVLQDVHWSGGMFGYFPSYSLGNIYAAQFANKIRQDLPEYEDYVRNGDLSKIKEWAKENIYKYGKLLSPKEILLQVTGEELKVSYLVDYLETKFKAVYKL
ncbi:MAG: carboxypeptidase M32 [Bacilli bacterium]